MSWYRRATSSFSIGLGLLFIIAGIQELTERDFYRHRDLDESISYMLIGAALTGSGAWTKRSLRLQKQQQERDRLRSILYGLLRQNDTLTVLQFAIAAQVAGEVAKQFLEQQAQVFGAEYEVSDRGEMIYRFRGGQWPLQSMTEEAGAIAAPIQPNSTADAAIDTVAKMYDVVLYACP
ncbi:MAG: hypothetical protein F6K28_38425, partial [Microcoleus sp. SIO2G3]|nr:hypothetical protein [Microcoleus sp. SIO2G3]